MFTQPKTETNIKLPLFFILYSLIAFVLSQGLVLWRGAGMLDGAFRTPILWSAAHLLLLGWALMVAMGSMYQLVPVAFLTPIWSERFGFFQFAVSAIGITAFAFSLAVFPQAAYHAGILTLIGILLFIFQMVMTLRKQAEKNILTLFVGTALFCLLTTIVLGILLALNMGVGLMSLNHENILKSHILLGTAGWFSLLIFGFSYKMVPMFSLAHGFSMKLSKPVYVTYVIGLAITLASLLIGNQLLFPVGMFILFIGFLLFAIHMKEIVNKRIKKKLDKPFIFSLVGILFGLLIHLLAFVFSIILPTPFAFGILILLYILGWIVFSIIGYLIKIVPFLWWTHRYSDKVGKENVPALKDMMNEKINNIILVLLPIAVVGLVFSFIFQAHSLFIASQLLLTALSLLFSWAIMQVLQR